MNAATAKKVQAWRQEQNDRDRRLATSEGGEMTEWEKLESQLAVVQRDCELTPEEDVAIVELLALLSRRLMAIHAT